MRRYPIIKRSKQKKLETAGWKVGSVKEFPGLSADEVAYIDLKLAVGDPSVSIDLLVELPLSLGASRKELASVIVKGY